MKFRDPTPGVCELSHILFSFGNGRPVAYTDTRRPRAAVLPRLARRLPGRPHAYGWRDAVLQVALWGMADLLYEGVRGIVVGHQGAALANANRS